MTVKVKHLFVNPVGDAGNTNIVRPSDWNADHSVLLNSRTVTGTTDTLLAADDGSVVKYTSSSAVTVTLPNNLPVDWSVAILRFGTGTVTFSAASGASIVPATGASQITARYQFASVLVATQGGSHTAGATGTTAVYVISGDVS